MLGNILLSSGAPGIGLEPDCCEDGNGHLGYVKDGNS